MVYVWGVAYGLVREQCKDYISNAAASRIDLQSLRLIFNSIAAISKILIFAPNYGALDKSICPRMGCSNAV